MWAHSELTHCILQCGPSRKTSGTPFWHRCWTLLAFWVFVFFFCPKMCNVVLVMSVKVTPAGTGYYLSGDLLAGQGFVAVARGDGCSAEM